MNHELTYEVKVYGSGTTVWHLNGKIHRENGPAIEYASGAKYWWLNGKPLTKEKWLKEVQKLKGQ